MARRPETVAKLVGKTFTIWDLLGGLAACVAFWCGWMLIQAFPQYPESVVDMFRYLCGFLFAGCLVLVFTSIRWKAWIMLGLCILFALASLGLLLHSL